MVILKPSKWSKNTAIIMARLAAGAVPGLASVGEDSGEDDADWDLSVLSDEELELFSAISQKLVDQGKGQAGKRARQAPEPGNHGIDQSGAARPEAAVVGD
jgi:hypothetical protein